MLQKSFRLVFLVICLFNWVLILDPKQHVIEAAVITEVEANDTLETAQLLGSIGYDSSVQASITSPGDIDWYRFDATSGRTYVVEIFNVGLGLDASGSKCNSFNRHGIGFEIRNPSGTVVVWSCEGSGIGNIHNQIIFTANTTGGFYIRILHNSNAVTGNYNLRILPKYNEPFAGWDLVSYEPNNALPNSFIANVNRTNFLSSAIDQRNPTYLSFHAENDWYRFTAVSGRTYVIELFNVSNTMGTNGSACNSFLRDGLGLRIFDPLQNQIVEQCDAEGSGNAHNIFAFTASLSGDYFIKILPNNDSVAGPYNLRILPKYDEPGADWDPTTFEPNNDLANAYEISVGNKNGLTSQIEQRNPSYSTYVADFDWYRFIAEAGKTYEIQLSNVTTGLDISGTRCNSFVRRGLAIELFDQLGDYVTWQCDAKPQGYIHNTLTFTAGLNGTYYVRLLPNNNSAAGTYTLRVCENTCTLKVFLPMIRK